jgi:shikimate kinase
MKGIGISHSAISVLNAIPCGIGAVIGTELQTVAEFQTGGDGIVIRMGHPETDDLLARICVARTLEALEEERCGLLDIRSQIPVSRGLKSSSAAANAIVAAVCSALRADKDRMWMLKLGVECALEAKVTVTGAFDDACGCMFGGFVMTDNTEKKVLMAQDLERMDVLLHVPSSHIRKDDGRVQLLRGRREEMIRIVETARHDPLQALTANGRLVAATMGLDDSLAQKALRHGALAAGISGTGPAVAILAPEGEGKTLMDEMGMEGLMITRTRRQEHGTGL